MLNISFYLTLSSKISKLLILTLLLINGCFFGVSPILLTQHRGDVQSLKFKSIPTNFLLNLIYFQMLRGN